MTTYRGIKTPSDNNAKQDSNLKAFIYRGVKYNTLPSKSNNVNHGIYRGTKWTN